MTLHNSSTADGMSTFRTNCRGALRGRPLPNPDLRFQQRAATEGRPYSSFAKSSHTNRKHCATVGCVGGDKGAAVLGDDPVSEGEADAVALRFRRKERNEDLLQIGGRDPWSIVTHLNYYSAILTHRTDNHTTIRICFSTVANEIQQRLSQHSFVRANRQ